MWYHNMSYLDLLHLRMSFHSLLLHTVGDTFNEWPMTATHVLLNWDYRPTFSTTWEGVSHKPSWSLGECESFGRCHPLHRYLPANVCQYRKPHDCNTEKETFFWRIMTFQFHGCNSKHYFVTILINLRTKRRNESLCTHFDGFVILLFLADRFYLVNISLYIEEKKWSSNGGLSRRKH